MVADLVHVLGTRETTALEFKESAVNRDRIAEVVCAFAYDLPGVGGGDVIIGVADNGQPVGGVDTTDRELPKLTELRLMSSMRPGTSE